MRSAPTTNAMDEARKALDRATQDAYQRGLKAGREEALGGEVVKASAWVTDESIGYDRWKADELSGGRGTHHALIVILGPRAVNVELPSEAKR